MRTVPLKVGFIGLGIMGAPMAGQPVAAGRGFCDTLGDAVVTGPMHTNVNDFRSILIE